MDCLQQPYQGDIPIQTLKSFCLNTLEPNVAEPQHQDATPKW